MSADEKERGSASGPEQSDEECALVKKTMDTFYRLKNYRKRYDRRWMDYYRLMRGNQWDYRRPKWKNSEVVNLIWQTIQSQIPLQTDVRPRFSFLAKEPSDVQFAQILDSIAESDFENQNWLKVVFEILWDSWIYGTSYSSTHYDQEADYGLGAATWQSEDPFACYPHPDANDINDQESECFFYASPIATDKLKRAFPDRAEYIKPDIFDRIKKERTELKTFTMSYFSSDKQLAEGHFGSSDSGQDDVERTMVIEAYYKPIDVEEEVEEEEKEGEEKETEGTEEEKPKKYVYKKKYPNGRHIVIANNMILHDGPLPYDDNLFPFAKLNNYILPREFFGVSEIEALESPQIVFNKLLSFSLDSLALTGNPIWIIDSNSEVDTDNLANIPGAVVEKNPGSEVRRESGVSLNPSFFSMLDRLVGWFNTVAGQSEFSQGDAPGGVTAASAIEQLIRASRQRVRQKQRNLDLFMKEAGRLYMNRVFQYYTVPKIFRITNSDGSQMFRKFRMEKDEQGNRVAVYSDYQETPRGMIEGKEDKLILKGNLDIRVTTGSELPFDVADNERKALALFDRGIIDAEEVLTRIEYPNKEKVLQRMSQMMQQAQAQAGAQQQGVIMAMQEEMAQQGAPAEQGGGGQDTAQVMNDVANGLAVVTDAIMQSQAPDEVKSRMQGVMQEYVAILQELMGGGAGPQGAEPVEQVGQPMSPAGV